mgnify:CR=1 FL=1
MELTHLDKNGNAIMVDVSEKEMIDRLMNKYPNSDKIQWNRDTDNFDVLSKSDILSRLLRSG